MELRHLMTFKTIVDVGGFKKAAEELGYAQSSITSHIQELEKELGSPLFDRLGKNVTLTQTGRSFLPYAVDIIKLYSKSKEAINQIDEPRGQLIIGVTESIMIYWLPNIIMEFMEKFPNIEITLKSLDYNQVTTQLKKGDIDLAILVETSDWDSKELIIQKLKNEKLSVVQSSKRPQKTRSETMLFTEQSCSWRSIFEDYLKNEGKISAQKVELSSIEAIKKCVLCGLGTSMLPYFAVQEEIRSGELTEVSSKLEKNPIAIYSAFHKNKWLSVNVEVFLRALREQIKIINKLSLEWRIINKL
jgi:DNA-binding transcriptional LysR family regulator